MINNDRHKFFILLLINQLQQPVHVEEHEQHEE